MIKNYRFSVSLEEKNRILLLHENATKKHYLKEEKEIVFPVQNLSELFEYGKYSSQKVKDTLLSLKEKIDEIVKNPKFKYFTVKIEAGESQVTNPEGFEQKGSLALQRAKETAKYFNEIFPELIKSGKMKISVPTINEVEIGKTPYDKTKGDKDNPEKMEKYRHEQYVRFYIEGETGVGDIPPKTKFSCTTKEFRGEGVALKPINNYAQSIDWEVGSGEGVMYFWAEALSVPDIIFFVYNEKSYGVREFIGDSSDEYRLLLGTILRIKYGDSSQLPTEYYGNTKFEKIEFGDSFIKDNLPLLREGQGLYFSFFNTFGQGEEFENLKYLELFKQFDEKLINVKSLIKNLGPDFPWGKLTSDILPGLQKNIGPVDKVMGLDTVKLFNVSPAGTTKWNVGSYCNPF